MVVVWEVKEEILLHARDIYLADAILIVFGGQVSSAVC